MTFTADLHRTNSSTSIYRRTTSTRGVNNEESFYSSGSETEHDELRRALEVVEVPKELPKPALTPAKDNPFFDESFENALA